MFEWLHPRRPGGRIAVWIVAAIALASIATGIGAILTRPALEAGGSVGDLQSAAEFSGTIVGFALLVTAWGMRRGTGWRTSPPSPSWCSREPTGSYSSERCPSRWSPSRSAGSPSS
ncbi:hypothetical protein [Natrinema sp. SYSU A 869]|uniref:hypothetical protein n=1 Tax=Natrinema sp. SYSU A 869 TaxID=2871694 RepID=UPI0031F30D31